jgi:hypothetical protein
MQLDDGALRLRLSVALAVTQLFAVLLAASAAAAIITHSFRCTSHHALSNCWLGPPINLFEAVTV